VWNFLVKSVTLGLDFLKLLKLLLTVVILSVLLIHLSISEAGAIGPSGAAVPVFIQKEDRVES
jgi:hypothetical protein